MIKPIETRYAGCRFRSRLEARYAVAFDHMKKNGSQTTWAYEIEGFDLGDAGYYLPDFWFPDMKCWGEVKPNRMNEIEIKKVKALCIETDYPVLLLIGMPHESGNPVVRPANDGGFDIDHWFYFGSEAIIAALSARFEYGESG